MAALQAIAHQATGAPVADTTAETDSTSQNEWRLQSPASLPVVLERVGTAAHAKPDIPGEGGPAALSSVTMAQDLLRMSISVSGTATWTLVPPKV